MAADSLHSDAKASCERLKILIVGEWCWPWYQQACADALSALGHQVFKFGWNDDFKIWIPNRSEPVYRSFLHRLQYGFLWGPIPWRINRALVRLAREKQPDVVWFYNVQIITASTVRQLRKILPRTIFCQYANDNPFSCRAKANQWRHFKQSIPYFDLHYTYRKNNIADYMKAGARQVHLLRSYFIPQEDFPQNPSKTESRFQCDVVFAGHYEDDGRVEILEAICKAGFRLNLFGGGWNAALPRLSPDSPLHRLFPVSPVIGDDYRQALCGAKVALCFLSTLNQDSYTRRNFQIPAMRVAMLCQYSEDLANLFQENEEAVFFRNPGDLQDKLKWLVNENAVRVSIAEAGFRRVYADGHDVGSRMRMFVKTVKEIKGARDVQG